MQATMKIREEKLLQFQELVKKFDFRFVGNPYLYGGYATVLVNAEHVPMEKCNKFFQAWNQMNTDILEIPQRSKFQRFIKKIKAIIF